MPTITINGRTAEFNPGEMILQVANRLGVDIPQYCYHDGLTIVASCRICLGEIWAPNPRNVGPDGKPALEPFMGGKLMPTCQTPASDGMVVYTDSPKSVANQKAVMEYLLINHPLDCPVCDQAGECLLQDYSYQYGRGVSRFEEAKVKQPKKDLGPNVLLYSDRCILCSRCVRFTREVTGTNELMIQGRGNRSEIDVFPGVALDNELSLNVVDLCPVGALLDKDFLFAQRVWFLKATPTIDGYTASGDNIWAEHNEGRMYRFKPRTNLNVNRWWITDEVRYSWKFVHSDDRLGAPSRLDKASGRQIPCTYARAYAETLRGLTGALGTGGRGATAIVVSPMLTCEDAFQLARTARAIDSGARLFVGPVPFSGNDKHFPASLPADSPKAFRMYAEKAPNARGVRRALTNVGGGAPAEFADFERAISGGQVNAVVLTGNYPSTWATDSLIGALRRARERGLFVALIDTLDSELASVADVVLPGATWLEKDGSFENARGMIQAFSCAIPPFAQARAEAQIAMDLREALAGDPLDFARAPEFRVVDEGPGQVPNARSLGRAPGAEFCAISTRREMAGAGLAEFADLPVPETKAAREVSDMEMVEL